MDRREGSAGFLLIEVAVALAILALAFGFGFRILSASLARLAADHRGAEARLLAQSTLDRVGADFALAPGESEGRAEDGLAWTVQTTAYTAGAAAIAAGVRGYLVRVTVTWPERGAARSLSLSTVRLVAGRQG